MPGKAIAVQAMTNIGTSTPPSFNGDTSLYAWNLFLMTALTFLGLMMAGKQANRIWVQRFQDHPLDPVSLYRLILLFCSIAVTLRSVGEAMLLWGWSPTDPDLTARVIMAKRWIDPIAVSFSVCWMGIAILGEPMLEHQLRKAPLPVDMWSRWPALARALGVIALSFVAALAAVVLR